MAKGESRWSPKDREVAKNQFRIAPTKDYTLKSKKEFRVQCKEETGAIPYVSGRMSLLGTEDEDGKTVSLFMPFYLTLTKKKEDGKPAVDLPGGLTEFCQMMNIEPPDEIMNNIVTHSATEERGEVESLNAKLVKEWLNNLGEFTVRGHVKKKPAKAPWPEKNEVSNFLVSEDNKLG